eukprot:1083260-Prorocentrum_minimum.AAC.1
MPQPPQHTLEHSIGSPVSIICAMLPACPSVDDRGGGSPRSKVLPRRRSSLADPRNNRTIRCAIPPNTTEE